MSPGIGRKGARGRNACRARSVSAKAAIEAAVRIDVTRVAARVSAPLPFREDFTITTSNRARINPSLNGHGSRESKTRGIRHRNGSGYAIKIEALAHLAGSKGHVSRKCA